MDIKQAAFFLVFALVVQVCIVEGKCDNNALGLADSYILDDDMTSSTGKDSSTPAQNGRLNYTAGSSWCSAVSDMSPYLQIDLEIRHIICAVATQGNSQADQWVKKYKLQFSTDNTTWHEYKERGKSKIFLGNYDRRTIVKNVLLTGINAQYLRILSQEHHGGACMRVELYGMQVKQGNLALYKPTSQSSTNVPFVSSNAVDGSRETNIQHCTHTLETKNPWWRVDLEKVEAVSDLYIVNRGDCCGSRLNGFEITVGNTTTDGGVSNQLCGDGLNVPEGEGKLFHCKPVAHGRYVHIRIPGSNKTLTLCEVEVYEMANLALKQPANQSSIDNPSVGLASWAVDGLPSTDWGDRSCTHTKTESNPWWRVDLGSSFPVAEIFIANRDCRSPCGDRLREFQIIIENDTSNAGTSNAQCGGIRKLNSGEKKSFYCLPRLVGRYVVIRIPGDGKTLTICELEVYSRKRTTAACRSQPVGITDYGIIPDQRFTASTSRSGNPPSEGRLKGNSAWLPTTNNNTDDYLQIDLGSVYFVCAVATQGNPSSDDWTTTYKIKTSLDNVNWTTYTESNTDKFFTGNGDRSSIIRNDLYPSTQARFVRIYPVSFNTNKALRLEVYGAQRGCQSSLGLENNKLEDSQMTASSEADSNHVPSLGRLYNATSWCNSGSSSTEYLQVDLGHVRSITGVATQGDPASDKWVTSFLMRFGHVDGHWLRQITLQGNDGRNKVVVNWLTSAIEARFVRIVPLKWQNSICMRIDLYGCAFLQLVLPPRVTGLSDQQLDPKEDVWVELTCNVSGVMQANIRWENNGKDITNLSSGYYVRGSFALSSLRVNFTSVKDIFLTWNCTRQSHLTRAVNCRLEYKCLGFYSSLAGGTVEQRAVISTQLNVPAAIQTLTVDTIQGTSAIIRWKQPAVGDGEGQLLGYQLQVDKEIGLQNSDPINISASDTAYVLKNLQRNTMYQVKIRAVSSVGIGLWSPTNIKFRTARTVNCEEALLGNKEGLFANMVTYSLHNVSSPAFNAILDNGGPAWCANTSEHAPYLEISFSDVYVICALSTQGNYHGNQWVETYQLQYSFDGTTWADYKEGTLPKIFMANSDSTSVVKQELYSGIVGRRIRLLIKSFSVMACVKLKIYGIKKDLDNLAVYKPTSQSSTDGQAVSSRAVDGNTGNTMVTCTHTSAETNPWWRVDLGQVEPVSELFVVNRGDCCGDRLSGFEIIVGNDTAVSGASNQVCASNLKIPKGLGMFFLCKPALYGRYVIIWIRGNNKILTLCEVEVYSTKNRNLALKQPANQSSMDSPSVGLASWAVDGLPSTDWGDRSCTHTKTESDPWWRVDLGSSFPVGEIVIVNRDCIDTCGDRLKGFEIRIGDDDNNAGSSNAQYGGLHNLSRGEKKSFYCDPPLVGQYVFIRIPGAGRILTICELEVYTVGRINKACASEPVGIADSSVIPDHRFSASTYNNGNSASHGRLGGSSAWSPSGNNNADDYLQIDLGSVYFVCAVATQGNPSTNQWTTTYKIKTSLNNANWTTYTDNSSEKIFDGNTDKDSIRRNPLTAAPVAKFVRFYPVQYNSSKSLRVEVYGLAQGSKAPVGMENRDIADTQITASTNAAEAAKGRLYNDSSWCSSTSSTLEYLQVDLGHVKTVTGVATQGDPSSDKWVTKYHLQYSYQADQWIPLKDFSQSIKTLTGNDDRNGLRVNWMTHPFVARYLRVYPQTWNSSICLRFDAYASGLVNKPIIRPALQNETLLKTVGSSVTLSCTVYGIPHVTVTWENYGMDITNTSGVTQTANIEYNWEKTVTNFTVSYINASYTKSQFQCARVSEQSRILKCPVMRLTCKALYRGTLLQALSSAFVSLVNDLVLPDAPSQPVIANITSTSVSLSWNRPEAGDGPILEYKVFCNSSLEQEAVNITTPTTRAVLNRLQPYTLYSVKVQAVSSIGKGFLSDLSTFRSYLPAKVYLPAPTTNRLVLGQKNISFVCYGEGYPMASVAWKKDGNLTDYTVIAANLSAINSSNILELRREGISYQEAGNYTCEVYNGVDGKGKVSRQLEVIFIPEFVTSPRDKTVLVAESLVLNCQATGVPAPIITWSHNGSGGLPPGSRQLSNGSLLVPNTSNTAEYEGVYECTATNRAGAQKAQAQLTVWVSPSFSYTSKNNLTLLVGEKLNLTCAVIGDPHPVVIWNRNGEQDIPAAHFQRHNTTLLIPRVSISDEAVYRCVGKSQAGETSAKFSIVVQAPSDVFVPGPRLIKLNRGQPNVSIECRGYGKPTPEVVWKQNGVSIATVPAFDASYGNNTVQVIRMDQNSTPWNVTSRIYIRANGITYAESGEYVCEVNNKPIGNSTARQAVEIVFIPEFHVKPKNTIAPINSNVTFGCNASGVPNPVISWSFSGGPLPLSVATNDTLTVFLVQNAGEYEGNYTCNASSQAGVKSTTVRLTVDVPPRITPLQNVSLLINSNLNITCIVSGDPFPVVYWTKNGTTNIPNSQFVNDNRTLLINTADIDVDGTYTCVASNRAGNSSSGATVEVLVKPGIYVSPPHVLILAQHQKNTTVDCRGYGKPTPVIRWLKNGVEVATLSSADVSNNSVRVFQVSTIQGPDSVLNVSRTLYIAPDGALYGEAGMYTCEVYNRVEGKSTVNETIQVLFRPEVLVSPKQQIILENRNASLSCYASGVPRPTVTWIHPPVPLTSQNVVIDVVSSNRTLAINRVKNTHQYETNYTCNASSIAGVEIKTAEIVVDVAPKVASPLGNVSLLINDRLNLTCEVEGDPTPSIHWYKDGSSNISRAVLLNSTKTLVINTVKIADEGRYKCVLQNRAGNTSSEAFVEIRVPPQISLSHGILNLRKHESNITVDCNGYGKPLPVVTWTKGNKPIPRVSVFAANDSDRVVQTSFDISGRLWNVTTRLYLRTSGITYSEAGNYTCAVSNGVGSTGSVIETTEVLFLPQFIRGPQDKVVLENNNVTFTCNATGVPSPSLFWSFSGGVLPPLSHPTGTTLTILKVQNNPEYEGNYTCIATNRAGRSNTTVELTIHVPGTIVNLSNNQSLIAGSIMNLTCDVIGDPAPSIRWLKNGSRVTERAELLDGNKTLIIPSVRVEDEGVYRCIVTNRAGNDSADTAVEVKAPACVYIPPPRELRLLSGDKNVTVDCHGYGKPAPTVRWTRNSKYVTNVGSITIGQVNKVVQVVEGQGDDSPWNVTSRLYLRVNGVTYEDAGNYTCEAYNGVGVNESETETLQVFFRPEFSKRPKDEIVNVGQNATFHCNASGVPDPSLSWMFRGENLPTHSTQGGSLTIYLVQNNAEYEGNYTCIALNRAGYDQDNALLTVDVPPFLQSPLQQIVEVLNGTTLNLTCSVSGDPLPAFYWTKDQNPFIPRAEFSQRNATLVIPEVKISDEGFYRCTAQNRAGNVSSKAEVNVQVPPMATIVGNRTLILLKGQANVTIDCYGKGHPAPVVVWNKGQNVIPNVTLFTNDDTLRVVQVTWDNVTRPMDNITSRLYLRIAGLTYNEAGNYSCTADNLVQGKPASTGIEVLFKPEFDLTPENQTVNEGESVTLSCEASGVPEPEISWKKDHGKLPSNSFSNGNLTMNSVKNDASYEGTYSCVASSRAGVAIFDVALTVHVPPQIITALNETVVAERGSTVILSCSASGDPEPRYFWKKDDSVVFPDAEFENFNKTLRLREVDSKNDGVYACLAKNDAGTNFTSSNVTIHARPSIVKDFPKKVEKIEGTRVILTCTGEAIPSPSVTWLKDNKTITAEEDKHVVITTDGEFTRTSHLTINSVKYEDFGEYTCLYSNYRGNASGTGRLVVYVPANITKPPASVNRRIASTVTLNCTARAFPSPSLRWTKNDIPLTGGGRIDISESQIPGKIESVSSLSFHSLIREDTGRYLCNATNFAGTSLETAKMTVLEKPDKLELRLVSSTARRVELKWNVTFDGNLPVLYYLITHNTSGGNMTFNVSFSEQLYELSGLKPATLYAFWVTATNPLGTSPPTVVYNNTLEAEPEAPRNLTALTVSSRKIFCNWTSPKVTNGRLTLYVLYYELSDAFLGSSILRFNATLPPNSTWSVIDHLEPFTNYTVQVQAFTMVGGGNRSATFGPVLTDEDVPEEPRDISKQWEDDKKEVRISWNPPLKPNGKITGYKVYLVLDNEGTENAKSKVFQIEGSSTNKLISLSDLNGDKEYRVIVQGKTSKGFGRNSTEKVIIRTPETAPPEPLHPPWYFENETTETTAVIELVKFSSINGEILFYQVVNLRVPKGTQDQVPEPKDIKLDDIMSYDDAHQSDNPAPYMAFQFKGEEFDKYRIFTLGKKERCCRQRREVDEYYNGPLHPKTEYRAFTRAFSSPTTYSQSKYAKILTKASPIDPSPSPPSPSSGGVIAGVVVAVLLVLICSAVVIYIKRKRNENVEEDADANELQPLPEMTNNREGSTLNKGFKSEDEFPPLPIPVESLKEQYLRKHADDDRLFSEEFKSIKISGSPTTVVCDLPENKVKNRYLNIKAYDHSRVILKREGVSGYINANYIDGYNCPRQYIATIGPKAETTNDFWWMIWQEKSTVIVMLTRPVENGKVKCYQYWPTQGSQEYGPLVVRVKEVEELADFEIRTLSLVMPSRPELKPRLVTHFFFTAWPDHDVPDHATGLLQFWKRVKKVATDESPVVVHCSAGVGRTGTFLVIDAMMKQIAASDELDIYSYVTKMREQRNMMVQRQAQYSFVHYALLEAITFGDTEIAVHDMRIKIKALGEKDLRTDQDSFEREFSLLDGVIADEKLDFTSALKEQNTEKNRYANVLPYEKTRVPLSSTSSKEDTTYINANFLEGFRERKAYIATQAPLQNTIADFWRMIWEHKVCTIVMLARQKEDLEEPFVSYWSEKETTWYGSLTVETTDAETQENCLTRQINLTDTEKSETRKITHFEFSCWPKDGVPSNPSSVLDLISTVQKAQQQSGNRPIVVHCSDGIGRTGAFCALNTCIESVKLESTFDVCTSVRMLRTQRPGMVQTLEQYKFIYDAIVTYVDSFESAMYQNFL